MDHKTPTTPNTSHLIDEAQLEERTGISRRNWERRRRLGNGPPFLKIGRLVRYPTGKQLDDWLEKHLRTSTSDPGPEARPRITGGGTDPTLSDRRSDAGHASESGR